MSIIWGVCVTFRTLGFIIILSCFVDLQKIRQPGDAANGWNDAEEDEDNANDEDILDVCMPKGSGAKGGGGAKGKKRNRGRRGRDKTRFRQS